ncbi:hypothetical protein C7M84_021146 [Penaeus vannamei]|uniref:Uncharacterized protein n=1 Tax=Penaeus vannamei TaxID=6689 RepID=A0A3R7LWI0_PENVA|nr:hypothetical protein C7M84_021146 [Penaeus vannamei]
MPPFAHPIATSPRSPPAPFSVSTFKRRFLDGATTAACPSLLHCTTTYQYNERLPYGASAYHTSTIFSLQCQPYIFPETSFWPVYIHPSARARAVIVLFPPFPFPPPFPSSLLPFPSLLPSLTSCLPPSPFLLPPPHPLPSPSLTSPISRGGVHTSTLQPPSSYPLIPSLPSSLAPFPSLSFLPSSLLPFPLLLLPSPPSFPFLFLLPITPPPSLPPPPSSPPTPSLPLPPSSLLRSSSLPSSLLPSSPPPSLPSPPPSSLPLSSSSPFLYSLFLLPFPSFPPPASPPPFPSLSPSSSSQPHPPFPSLPSSLPSLLPPSSLLPSLFIVLTETVQIKILSLGAPVFLFPSFFSSSSPLHPLLLLLLFFFFFLLLFLLSVVLLFFFFILLLLPSTPAPPFSSSSSYSYFALCRPPLLLFPPPPFPLPSSISAICRPPHLPLLLLPPPPPLPFLLPPHPLPSLPPPLPTPTPSFILLLVFLLFLYSPASSPPTPLLTARLPPLPILPSVFPSFFLFSFTPSFFILVLLFVTLHLLSPFSTVSFPQILSFLLLLVPPLLSPLHLRSSFLTSLLPSSSSFPPPFLFPLFLSFFSSLLLFFALPFPLTPSFFLLSLLLLPPFPLLHCSFPSFLLFSSSPSSSPFAFPFPPPLFLPYLVTPSSTSFPPFPLFLSSNFFSSLLLSFFFPLCPHLSTSALLSLLRFSPLSPLGVRKPL